jgi:HSF-type DNA-binding
MPIKGEYTMRAQPRRRKESTSKGDEPIFLRKTFDLISSCDSSLAGWSRSGETFIIKDPERFASEVIPVFFKHSKFSSFVRQLNFYGFRKVKSAAPLDDPSADSSQWWEFKHDSFLRDQPHLLSEIKRATHYSDSPNQEVGALRSEVSSLQERIMSMDEKINALTEMVEALIREKAVAAAPAPAAAAVYAEPESAFTKKRKVDVGVGIVREGSREGDVFNPNNLLRPSDVYGAPGAVKQEYCEQPQQQQQQTAHLMMPPAPLQISEDHAQAIDFARTMSTSSDGFFNSDLLEGLGMATGFDLLDFDGPAQLTVDTGNTSSSSSGSGLYDDDSAAAGFGSTDEQCDAMLMSPTGSQQDGAGGSDDGFALDADETTASTDAVEAATESVTDLALSLSALPAAAQEQLAEGLLAIMKQSSTTAVAAGGNGSSQAERVAVAATAAVSDDESTLLAAALQSLQVKSQKVQPKASAVAAGGGRAPEIAMPLASAALGAFLTRFARTQGPLLHSTATAVAGHEAFVKAVPRTQVVAA